MVEVFKTTIYDPRQAAVVLNLIHGAFSGYSANFDLEDCDKILRVECATGGVEAHKIMGLVSSLGHVAEILPDTLTVVIPNT
jgi:hypothetical protein